MSRLDAPTAELGAEFLAVLADPTRLQIMSILSEAGGQYNVNELAEQLGRRPATISQHLSLLRRYALVQSRREGVNLYYWLSDPKAWDTQVKALQAWMQFEEKAVRTGSTGINAASVMRRRRGGSAGSSGIIKTAAAS